MERSKFGLAVTVVVVAMLPEVSVLEKLVQEPLDVLSRPTDAGAIEKQMECGD